MNYDRVLKHIKDVVAAHQPGDGTLQWYTDEAAIDCDAPEFWKVVLAALATIPREPVSTRPRAVLPIKFVEALEAAGLVSDKDRIYELAIICKPDDFVTINVKYVADDRIFNLAG